MNPKIKKFSELVEIVKKLKKEDKKIVTTNGSFDLVHAGHIAFLYKAKEQGDILIVGLNSDSSIKQYKSKDRPIISQKDRAELMAALEMVDYVFIFDETTPVKFISILKPDVHANAAQYGKECIEANAVKEAGGKLYLVPTLVDVSTTKIINKIIKVYGKCD